MRIAAMKAFNKLHTSGNIATSFLGNPKLGNKKKSAKHLHACVATDLQIPGDLALYIQDSYLHYLEYLKKKSCRKEKLVFAKNTGRLNNWTEFVGEVLFEKKNGKLILISLSVVILV